LRLKLVLVLGCALSAALIAYLLWGLLTGLVALASMLAGIALGRSSSNQTDETALPDPVTSSVVKARGQRNQAQSPALLEAMMNGVREGVIVIDDTVRVVASNNAARVIFNQSEGKMKGARLSALTRSPAIHAAVTAALLRGERTEVKVELPGGERRSFDMCVLPLVLEREKGSRGAIGVFFDITRLERLEQVRQEFLSNVSHELRTPLTSILAFVETLEDGAIHDPSNSGRFLSVIHKNAVRMHHLINDILELSLIEAGTTTLKTELVRLRPMVDDIINALGARAESRHVHLHTDIDAGELVLADPLRLEQMLTNLIDNAVKFNREGGSVTIAFERGARDYISVSDTGEGIPGEHVERVFERFYRVDRARSAEDGSSSGLGLAIVKHLARLHGGEATVRSTPNEGSTFIIELPTAEQPAAAAKSISSTATP
jgi:two-component system phosphate regulon sensor histidine kinase PhoR